MKKSFLAICFAVLSLGSFAEDKIYEAKAEARGYNEDGVPIVLTVKATKKDGKVVIKDIVAQHKETDKIGGVAIEQLIKQVKDKQNYNKVDGVSGATSQLVLEEHLEMLLKILKSKIKNRSNQ